MIYVDSSVVLAELLDEERQPPASLWRDSLTASRLVQYEVWTRLHRGGHGPSHGRKASLLLERLALVDMLPSVLKRAMEPFPAPLRTLDAMHLATAAFLRSEARAIKFASYDNRLIAAARALDFPIAEL